jgi:hypothetical protein
MKIDYKKPLSEAFIEKHSDKINWRCIWMYQNLSESFIEKHSDKVNWYNVSRCQKLSEEFIEKHLDNLDWEWVSIYQKLSEEFIEKHSDKLNWEYISRCQKLSEEFIEKHSDKLYWSDISGYQKLSEEFIENHSDKVKWNLMSCSQKLSEEFIEKHSDKVNWNMISQYQKLSESFIRKHNLSIPESSWLYKSDQEKENYIRNNTDYEIIDTNVIAYKSCRSDGHSRYNLQYFYEVGKEYECHADYNPNNENSFGLSAWTKEGAIEYCNEKLFKVQISIADVACILHNGKQIRACKMKILEEIRR